MGASERALCETMPTTRAGALRLLRHLADFLDEDDVVNDLHVVDVVGDASATPSRFWSGRRGHEHGQQ